MLTTSNVSMIQAGKYYGKDDYYARTLTKEDFWFGNGLLSPLGDSIPNPNQVTIVPLNSSRLRSHKKFFKRRVPPPPTLKS